jgi:stage II sporulation protein D
LPQENDIHQPDVIARFHINSGRYLIDRGDFLGAHVEFQTAIETASLNSLKTEGHAYLAQLSASFLDNSEEGIQEYSRVVEGARDSEFYRNAVLQLGILQYQQGHLEEARKTFQRFITEFSQDPQATTARFMLAETGKYLQEHRLPPPAPPPVVGKTIRVCLGSVPEARITGSPFRISTLEKDFKGESIFAVHGGQLFVGSQALGSTPVELTAETMVRFKARSYRGSLTLVPQKDQIQIVNRIPIELYLYSVVGSEMSPHWPREALKAQAVAARTYAAYAMVHPVRDSCDLYDDVHSQAYNGASSEHALTREAVDATAGQVLQHRGAPILAYFTSNNGGRSDSSSAIFGVSLPYFQVQDDPFSRLQPLGHWERHFTAEQIRNALWEFGFQIGRITDIRVADKTGSGRVSFLDVVSQNRTLHIRCRNQFRPALNRYIKARNLPENLPDTLLEIAKQGDLYTISGGGWGHGVGLSQYGAKGRAAAGQDYAAILRAYYPSTTLTSLYPAAQQRDREVLGARTSDPLCCAELPDGRKTP